MRYRLTIPLAALLLAALAAPSSAEGRWCVSLSGGMSVSSGHGSALDAAVFAELDPILAIGLETGLAYMKEEALFEPIVWAPTGADGGAAIASVTDGITRNRGYYLGPTLKIGRTVYAVASAGLYEFNDNSGHATGTRWGGSAGIGISGTGRFEPHGELRYRLAQDGSVRASAIQFMFGFHIR